MNQAIKERWIESLRSGEYEQTQGRLRDETGYCCLGVLCDLYAQEKNIEWNDQEELGMRYYTINHEISLLPEDVMKWAELDMPNPACIKGNTVICLSYQNDTGFTFEQIAQTIERNF